MKLKYAIVVMVSAALFSCSKAEDGAIGPIGSKGEQGIQGPEGPQGAAGLNGGVDGQNGADGQDGADGVDGQDGADGNANVIASDWFHFENSDWSVNSVQSLASVSKDVTEITQAVMDNSVVIVYRQVLAPSQGPTPLPVYNGIWQTSFTLSLGEIRFSTIRTDGNNVSISNSSNVEYRYMIIPAASTTGKSSLDFEKMTYEEVMDHFELEY